MIKIDKNLIYRIKNMVHDIAVTVDGDRWLLDSSR